MLVQRFAERAEGDRIMSEACERFSVDHSAYFDGELEGAALAGIEAHLEACPGCKADLEKMGKLSNALHRVSGAPPTRRPLFEEIMERLAKEDEAGGGKNLPS